MARLQTRKRQRDEPLQANAGPPTKKINARVSWEYPPEFWDRLPKISLSHRALRELNRRTRTRRSYPSTPASCMLDLSQTTIAQDLARFASNGGPDLRDLRGYPHPPHRHQNHAVMSTKQTSRSKGTKSIEPASTVQTSATTKTKKSSAYNRDFEVHLMEHAIHPTWRSQEPDLEGIRAAIAAPRPSLSPSEFSDGAFKEFQDSNDQALDEDDVIAHVIPTILGPRHKDHHCARNTMFTNLEPLTDGTIVAAMPDIYYGAYPDQLAKCARDKLAGHIVPSTFLSKPMAPNFFLEVKGPDGSTAVAARQARYVGAIGARALHSLQNYGVEQPAYDGKAYTFSSTYSDGQLKLYAHHVTAPTQGGRPEYHMTQVHAYAMVADRDSFARGAAGFRNARDLAKEYRDNFILAVNARVTREITSRQCLESMAAETQRQDSPNELAPSPRLQHEDSPDELALSSPNYLDEGDGSPDASQEPAALGPDLLASIAPSFTTSFTSSSSHQIQSKSKRQRSPRLNAQLDEASNSRTRRRRVADLAPSAKDNDTSHRPLEEAE